MKTMRAMVLREQWHPLALTELPIPNPGPGQVLVKVHACAVCRTDLHVIDGDLTRPKLPLVLGHEIVGTIVGHGTNAARFPIGTRVGIPWLGWTCGECRFCKTERENLCEKARFTGYDIDGGFAEYTVADERFCFRLPDFYNDTAVAPLLCAGLIGYRSLVKCGAGKRLGIFGFGAAAYLIAQVARFRGWEMYAFTRKGDADGQALAKKLGAKWAGASEELSPEPLDAAIVFAAVGALVPLALKALDRNGIVVCGGIHMSEIPAFSYDLLWQERSLCSVANLTRKDGEEFLALAPQVPIVTRVETFPLASANEAVARLKAGKVEGAAVLVMDT